jgi:hypothetical protein
MYDRKKGMDGRLLLATGDTNTIIKHPEFDDG